MEIYSAVITKKEKLIKLLFKSTYRHFYAMRIFYVVNIFFGSITGKYKRSL